MLEMFKENQFHQWYSIVHIYQIRYSLKTQNSHYKTPKRFPPVFEKRKKISNLSRYAELWEN